MSGLRYTPPVASLPASVPFVGPETQERARGKSFSARIGANESVFGTSPRAVAAIRAEAAEIWRYGDPENDEIYFLDDLPSHKWAAAYLLEESGSA